MTLGFYAGPFFSVDSAEGALPGPPLVMSKASSLDSGEEAVGGHQWTGCAVGATG